VERNPGYTTMAGLKAIKKGWFRWLNVILQNCSNYMHMHKSLVKF
jgi:hypothetical protein